MAKNQKYALITGATSGIGHELAKLFAQDKYNLIIVARNQEDLDKTASEIKNQYGVEVLPIAKDLSASQAPKSLYDTVQAKGIQVDVLVNNAGQGQYGEFIDIDLSRELEIIQLNIVAYVALTKYFLKDMVTRNEGKILNTSSIAGELPGPLQAVYHATKAFITSFTEAVRNEVKDTKITITALLPGATDTDFFHKAEMEQTKMVQEGDLADPATVAKDGYEALMAGKDKVISGFKNKIQVAVSNVIPDSVVADNIHKQMEPSTKNKGNS